MQAQLTQALDLGGVIHHVRATGNQNAPPGPGLLVVTVGLERNQVVALGGRQLRPAGRAEDQVLPVHGMVHRQDHHLAVREETNPAHRHRRQQPQAHLKRQYLQPGVIGRMPWHVALLSNASPTAGAVPCAP